MAELIERLRRLADWPDEADPVAIGAIAGEAAAALEAAREDGRAAVLAEREACAKACDNRAAYYHNGDDDGPMARRGIAAEACAAVIRHRSNLSSTSLARLDAAIDQARGKEQEMKA